MSPSTDTRSPCSRAATSTVSDALLCYLARRARVVDLSSPQHVLARRSSPLESSQCRKSGVARTCPPPSLSSARARCPPRLRGVSGHRLALSLAADPWSRGLARRQSHIQLWMDGRRSLFRAERPAHRQATLERARQDRHGARPALSVATRIPHLASLLRGDRVFHLVPPRAIPVAGVGLSLELLPDDVRTLLVALHGRAVLYRCSTASAADRALSAKEGPRMAHCRTHTGGARRPRVRVATRPRAGPFAGKARAEHELSNSRALRGTAHWLAPRAPEHASPKDLRAHRSLGDISTRHRRHGCLCRRRSRARLLQQGHLRLLRSGADLRLADLLRAV